jgi:salicylate hydroxylase
MVVASSTLQGSNVDPILIAGAGIGGLTTALALQRQGFRPIIFEKARAIGDVGAGISLGRTASRSLYSLGLETALKAASDTPQASAARDYRTGEELGGAFASRKWTAADLVDTNMLHRADLFHVIASAVISNDPGALRIGHEVTGFAQDDDGVEAALSTGDRVRGAALIGCDGLRSTVRERLGAPGQPRKTGRVTYRFLIPMETAQPFLSAGPACIYVGSRVSLLRYVIRSGTLVNCVAFAHSDDVEQEGWSHHATREELVALFEGWHPDVVGLASNAPLDRTARWALYDRDPLERWVDGRVGLLGDAAHPMLPFLGFGAALAIEDAIVLARTFAMTDDPMHGLRIYQEARRNRANRILLESRLQGEIFDAGPGATVAHPPSRESRMAYDPVTVPLGDPAVRA